MDGEIVGLGEGMGEGVGGGAAATLNELLVPVWVSSETIRVAPEPEFNNVTETEPTPLAKAFILAGVIEPAE